MTWSCGIDFGTSNSTVGFSYDKVSLLAPVEGDKKTIPSAVFYNLEEKRIQFGREAVEAYVERYEGRFMRALKSVLGSSLIDDTTAIGSNRMSFKSIIGDFIGNLRGSANAFANGDVQSVVLGRPVFFIDNNEAADRKAQDQLEQIAKSKGFKSIEFQYEPIAAALDYEQSVSSEELALIADIGGGTSDFSIVRVSPQRRGKADRREDILANSGVHVGGTDFDNRLSINQVMPLFGYKTPTRLRPELDVPPTYHFDLATWHKIIFLYTRKVETGLREIRSQAAHPELIDRFIKVVHEREGHRIAGNVEGAKIALSSKQEANIDLSFVEPRLSAKVTRDQFEHDTSAHRAKIVNSIRECLAQADISAGSINTVFLTGGTTSIPSVYEACKSLTPDAKIVEGDKFGSVGAGLALDAEVKFGSRPFRVDDNFRMGGTSFNLK